MLTSLALGFLTVVAIASAWRLFEAWTLRVSGYKAQATVVAKQALTDNTYHPVVRFVDTSGQTHQVPIWIGGLTLNVGDTVDVIYPPVAPSKALLATPQTYILPTLGVIGPVFVAISLLVYQY